MSVETLARAHKPAADAFRCSLPFDNFLMTEETSPQRLTGIKKKNDSVGIIIFKNDFPCLFVYLFIHTVPVRLIWIPL